MKLFFEAVVLTENLSKRILQTAGKQKGDGCGFKYALARQLH